MFTSKPGSSGGLLLAFLLGSSGVVPGALARLFPTSGLLATYSSIDGVPSFPFPPRPPLLPLPLPPRFPPRLPESVHSSSLAPLFALPDRLSSSPFGPGVSRLIFQPNQKGGGEPNPEPEALQPESEAMVLLDDYERYEEPSDRDYTDDRSLGEGGGDY